jgi:glycosyltransferase involved in cell wall biosynthesis
MKVSVILPARNEELLVASVLKDISSYLKKSGFGYEILVVVNGCTDLTEEIVGTFAEKHAPVKILRSRPGYGYAIREGLKKAKGDYVALFNVDFYDLKMLDLIKINLYGKDVVIGSKMTPWSRDERPVSRRIVSKLFNLFLKFFLGFRGSDTHGIKIMKKRLVVKVFPKCRTSSGIFDTEFVLKTQMFGFKIADYPVDLKEVRPPRFINRFLDTPRDILNLLNALKKK